MWIAAYPQFPYQWNRAIKQRQFIHGGVFILVSFHPGWNYLLQSFWLLKKLNWWTCKTEVLIWEQQITALTQIIQTRSFDACKRNTEILHFIYMYLYYIYNIYKICIFIYIHISLYIYTYIYNCPLPGLPHRITLWTLIFSSCRKCKIDRAA